MRRGETSLIDGESRNILHVLLIREYGRSQYPLTMTLYRDPTQLAHPVRVVTGLNGPYGIAFNSRGEMVVCEEESHQVSIFDIRGQRIQTFGSYGDSPEQMEYPRGIAIDDMDNIYVTSYYKLQKFTSSGQLIRCIGEGSEEGEFNVPLGVTIYDNQVYVCDIKIFGIQVFDLELNFIGSIAGMDERFTPRDVKFDRDGNIYLIDKGLQVLDRGGHFIQVFGEERKVRAHAIHIVDKYVYMGYKNHILVYETSGQFVTSFADHGHDPSFSVTRISSCVDGFIYLSYWRKGIIEIF